MFIIPTPKDFREWQIWWYQRRLSDATSFNERRFLKTQLTNLYLN